MRVFFSTIFLLLTFTFQVLPQGRELDSLITAGVNQIYGIKFKDADSTFKLVMKKYPDNPAGVFFDTMIGWWKIMLDLTSEKYDQKFIGDLGKTIDFCNKILDRDPNNTEAMFFKGGALGFRGRLYSIRKEFFRAALDAKDALPLVYKVHEIAPTNKDVELGFGIYNYYAEVIPEKYPFIKPFMIFFPGGNRIKGIEQIKDVANNGHYAKIEATYFLLQIYYSFEKNYDSAMVYAKKLLKRFPDNPVFDSYRGRIYAHKGDWEKTAEIFHSIYKKCLAGFPGYNERVTREATYYIGNWFKIEGQMDSAIAYLKISARLSKKLDKKKQTGFLANSLLYLGMAYDDLGYRKLAVEKYKETLDVEDFHSSHQLAKKYLKRPYVYWKRRLKKGSIRKK